jgi:hypothetical protein
VFSHVVDGVMGALRHVLRITRGSDLITVVYRKVNMAWKIENLIPAREDARLPSARTSV